MIRSNPRCVTGIVTCTATQILQYKDFKNVDDPVRQSNYWTLQEITNTNTQTVLNTV